MRILIVILVLAPALHVSTAPAHSSDGTVDRFESVQVGQGEQSDVTLSGIRITCTTTGDMTRLQLAKRNAHWTPDIERSARVYVSSPKPTIVIVQDCFASNEDRLLLCDFSGAKPGNMTLTHSDAGDYVHLHFSVKELHNGRVSVEELEYAGSTPPRTRRLTIHVDRAGYHVTRGTWSNVPDSVTR